MSAPWLLTLVFAGCLLANQANATAPIEDGTATVSIIDLNTASKEALCTLPGIGPRKAEAILALREKRPFTRVTQLLLVKGIGPKTLARLKPRLSVGEPPGVSSEPVPST